MVRSAAILIPGMMTAAVLASQPATAPSQPNFVKLTHVVHAYASFAPGDRTIVFQSNANGNWDLYTMTVSGEQLRAITSDKAADITPVFSPDGKRIVFVSERDGNRNVYLCDPDGSNLIQLTNDPGHDIHPVFSPDGRRIMFSSNRGKADPADYDIYIMNLDGTGLRQVTSGPEVDTYASWSPDETKIITRRVIDGNNEVFIMNADGSGATNLTNDPARYDGWPVWAPDGKHIAFASGVPGKGAHFVYLMSVDGTARVQLSPVTPGWNFDYHTQPVFSHDGKRLIYTMYRPGLRESSELVMIDLPDLSGGRG